MSSVGLVVTGSIAAYKAPHLARLLGKAGLRVVPILTKSALEFVGRATMSGLTGEPVLDSAFGDDARGELHVKLGAELDLVVVAPATADFLARLAQGRSDDLATATCLCARAHVLLAPAMHPKMWDHPATRRNVETILRDGRASFVGPVRGEVASGDVGLGRMAEPEDIAQRVLDRLRSPRDLEGRTIVVSAGPTVEDLDPVRFLGNRSTGKMGFAIAARAAARGASVTVVAGPVTLETPPGVNRVDVRGALEMKSALADALGPQLDRADALIMTAAVGDYRAAATSPTKLKRDGSNMTIQLVPNPDLLAEIGAARKGARPVLVGFCVETTDDAGLIASATKKLHDKRVDFVVANAAADSFGRDDNRAILVGHGGPSDPVSGSKTVLADRILDRVAASTSARPA